MCQLICQHYCYIKELTDRIQKYNDNIPLESQFQYPDNMLYRLMDLTILTKVLTSFINSIEESDSKSIISQIMDNRYTLRNEVLKTIFQDLYDQLVSEESNKYIQDTTLYIMFATADQFKCFPYNHDSNYSMDYMFANTANALNFMPILLPINSKSWLKVKYYSYSQMLLINNLLLVRVNGITYVNQYALKAIHHTYADFNYDEFHRIDFDKLSIEQIQTEVEFFTNVQCRLICTIDHGKITLQN